MPPTAHLLLSHGSRDPRPAQAIAHLAQQITAKLSVPIETGVLELGDRPLHQQILDYSDRLLPQGYKKLQILPLFLLRGVHVMEDIPAEVAIAQTKLSDSFTIEILSALGETLNDNLEATTALLDHLLHSSPAQSSSGARILLSHGSRREGGNRVVEAIAQALHAQPAYWSVQPDLAMQVRQLIEAGHQNITIGLYFLFEGGITDGIWQLVQSLEAEYPQVQFHLSKVLGEVPELTDLVIQSLQPHSRT